MRKVYFAVYVNYYVGKNEQGYDVYDSSNVVFLKKYFRTLENAVKFAKNNRNVLKSAECFSIERVSLDGDFDNKLVKLIYA